MRLLASNSTFALFSAIAISAIVAACGGPPEPTAPTPGVPSASTTPTTPTTAMTSAPTSTPTTAPTTAPTTPATAGTTAPPAGKMPELTASAMGAELKAQGFDIDKLVAMKNIKTGDKVKLMPLFKKSTGMECNDCHDKDDKKKQTPNVQIAAKMWDEFVVKLKGTSGPLFCDSCHGGKHDFLVRSDKEAVKNLMNTYVSKLTKKSGDSASCQTCHTDDFEMKIFEKVWKIKR